MVASVLVVSISYNNTSILNTPNTKFLGLVIANSLSWKDHIKLTKLRGLSPRANYTDRAAAAGRRSKCQLLRIEDVTWSAQRIPKAVNLCFLDRSRYFFYSSSSSIDLMRLSGPRSRPTTTQKIW